MVVNVGNVKRMVTLAVGQIFVRVLISVSVAVPTKVGRIHWVVRGGSFLVGILKLQ